MSGWAAIYAAVFKPAPLARSIDKVTWRYVFKSGEYRVQFTDDMLEGLPREGNKIIYKGKEWEFSHYFPIDRG